MGKSGRRAYFRDEEFLKEIGLRIREIRLKKGLTQMDLAFACNESDYSQINRIELGKVNFSVSFLKLIATVLQVKPSDFVAAVDDNNDLPGLVLDLKDQIAKLEAKLKDENKGA